jgi:hypothetical protein
MSRTGGKLNLLLMLVSSEHRFANRYPYSAKGAAFIASLGQRPGSVEPKGPALKARFISALNCAFSGYLTV